MLVNGKVLNFSAMNAARESGEFGFAHLQVSGIETLGVSFSGSVADWCELGFSICESYLIEAQNIYIENDLGGFLSMAEAQFDADLSDEVLAHVFLGLLKQDAPLLYPDISYSFYPVYCGLYGIDYRQVPLTGASTS